MIWLTHRSTSRTSCHCRTDKVRSYPLWAVCALPEIPPLPMVASCTAAGLRFFPRHPGSKPTNSSRAPYPPQGGEGGRLRFWRELRTRLRSSVTKYKYLKEQQVKTELASINRELKRLKVQIAQLKERKSKLTPGSGKRLDLAAPHAP
jgi:hypothetical protein